MRRFLLSVPILAALLIGLFASLHLGVQSASQEGAPATPGHPLVGTWLLDLGEDGGRLLTFSEDGTAFFADADGVQQDREHGRRRATPQRSSQRTG